MNLFVFIATGVVILAYLFMSEVTDEMRAGTSWGHYSKVGNNVLRCYKDVTPDPDRLNYSYDEECYKHNADVFRPIEGARQLNWSTTLWSQQQPVFQPDPLGNTPLTR